MGLAISPIGHWHGAAICVHVRCLSTFTQRPYDAAIQERLEALHMNQGLLFFCLASSSLEAGRERCTYPTV